ncbi:unnamed protein product [Eretmochelys imbricata]
MATAATAGEIQDEAICSICLEYLMEPVTIACGHNFCRACVTRYSEEKGTGTPLTCPQCRAQFQKREFQINTQLNNIIQKIKQLGLKPGKGQKEDLCERHEEHLKRFCEDDGETICCVHEKSRDHKSHTVVPIEEAAQGCKPASWNRLLVRGVVAAVGVLILLYLCGFWKGRGKVFAYSRLVVRKLLTHPSPQPGSRQDSQESELPVVCDRDGDQAQGTRNRNRDPALEKDEGDLFANSYPVC